MPKNILTGGDGVSLGDGATDLVALYNSGEVPQRNNPCAGPLYPLAGGQVVTYQQTLTPAAIVTLTTAEQSLTVGTTAGNGLLATDFVAAVNKPTAQAGIGVHSARISAANTMFLTLSNTSAGTLTPTASQVYNVTVLRGFPVHQQALTPAPVPAATTQEQIFNLVPVVATGTAAISGGQVTSVTITAAGSNYTTPPVVSFNYGLNNPAVNPANPSVPFPNIGTVGVGATGVPIMSATGTILGVQITNPGSGYVTAPTVTFLGGNTIAPGMAVMVTKPTINAGVAISNARVTGINQIGVTFVNPTAAVVTPTAAETYSVVGLHSMLTADQITSYGVVGTGLVSVATITSSEQTLTVSGLLATDIAVGVQKPTLSVGLLNGTGRISAANTLQIQFVNPTAAAVTPSATEIYGVTVLNQTPISPFTVLRASITPTSVAANTTAEQTFTVVGLPFVNASPATVFVNKPSFQAGLAIAGCRISAANTLAITFENVTATAITPNTEIYTIGCFNAVGPGGGAPGSWVALSGAPARNALVNLVNEMQQTLAQSGIGAMKGSQ
jgi:hypothetical protein